MAPTISAAVALGRCFPRGAAGGRDTPHRGQAGRHGSPSGNPQGHPAAFAAGTRLPLGEAHGAGGGGVSVSGRVAWGP